MPPTRRATSECGRPFVGATTRAVLHAPARATFARAQHPRVCQAINMDNITKAELDAVAGLRGPPTSLFMAGSGVGDYRSQLLRPALVRDEKQRRVAAAMEEAKATSLRGTKAGASVPPAWAAAPHPRDVSVKLDALAEGGDLATALALAERTMVETEPVHVYDLKETAARKTQELVEREKMVRAARGVAAPGWGGCGCCRAPTAPRPPPPFAR
jgi:hypothetical protein